MYVGSDDSYVYALNASGGTLLWRFQTGPGLFVARCCWWHRLRRIARSICLCFEREQRRTPWKYKTGRAPSARLLLPTGWCTSEPDTYFYAVDAEPVSSCGTLRLTALSILRRWWLTVSCTSHFSVDDYNVYALNSATGALLWNYTTMSDIISSPTVADGMVYIGSSDQNLYAFHLPGHKDSN